MFNISASSLKTPPPRPAKPERKKKGKSMDKARVLFPYKAENEDELSIEEGDIITILDRELEDSGWWKGEIHGKVGVFPDNFVDIIPAEDNKPKKPPPPSINKPAAPDPERPVARPHVPISEVKPRDEKRTAPPLLPQKPAMPPPPLSKKPKSVDLITQTDDHKAQSQKDGPLNLDSVPTVETLPHLNSSRPNPPQHRRLPTVHRERKIKKEDSQPPPEAHEQPEEAEKEELPPPAPAPPPPIPAFPDSPRVRENRRAHRRAIQKGESPKAIIPTEDSPNQTTIGEEIDLRPKRSIRPAPPLPTNHPPPSPVMPTVDFPDGVTNGDTGQVIADLRKEIEDLKSNTVPRSEYDSLHGEIRHLRETVTKLDKLTRVLMNDIDEGTKERRGMQVEIDRVKKLTLLPSGS